MACYYNDFTGEVYDSHKHMLKRVFSDFIHYKSARSIYMFILVRKCTDEGDEK